MNYGSSPSPQEQTVSQVVPVPSEAEGTSFNDIFRALVKGKWFILICAVIGVAVSAFYVSIAKPVYEAHGVVRIDPSRSGSLGLTEVLSLGGGGDEIPTEIGILTSDQVALAALETLTPEQFQAFAGFPKSKMVFNLEDADHKPVRLNPQQEGVINAFKGSIAAKQNGGTQLVDITFRNGNPDIAASLLNKAVDAYLRQSFDSRYNSVVQVRGWLKSQLDELQKHALDAQQRLAQFQEQNNLVGTDPENNTFMDRLKLLNDRLTNAEGDRIVKEAQLRAAESGDPAVLGSLVPDAHLQALQGTEESLSTQYTQLATKFGPNYPPLMEVKQQLDTTRQEIKSSLGLITAHLREDLLASQQAENMLRDQYQKETEHAYALNRTQVDYAVLSGELSSSRDLYDTLQFRLQQATVNAGLDSINTMVINKARAPLVPIEPKKTLIVISGFILGLAIGVGAALLKETMGGEIQSISQVESGTGLVILSIVPHMDWSPKAASAGGEVRSQRRLVSLREPRSKGAESYRNLRNAVLLSSIDRPPRTTLVTSSIPGEGKSSTAANYALVLAQNGAKVLLIDADLRRPSQHLIFGVANGLGISDRLIDQGGPDDLLTPVEDFPNFHLMTSGKNRAFPSEILASNKFRTLLEQLEKEYDAIVIDSAPLLTVSDCLPLATIADTTIIVVRAGVTPLKALNRTKFILARAHARVAGVVLNDISRSGEEAGYYGKYGYGYYN